MITNDCKFELMARRVTLDGKPAKISGRFNQFATIATLPTGPSYDWAWETVETIVANGGAFKSPVDHK